MPVDVPKPSRRLGPTVLAFGLCVDATSAGICEPFLPAMDMLLIPHIPDMFTTLARLFRAMPELVSLAASEQGSPKLYTLSTPHGKEEPVSFLLSCTFCTSCMAYLLVALLSLSPLIWGYLGKLRQQERLQVEHAAPDTCPPSLCVCLAVYLSGSAVVLSGRLC